MAECAAPAVTCSIARCELWQSDNEVGLQMQHFDGGVSRAKGTDGGSDHVIRRCPEG